MPVLEPPGAPGLDPLLVLLGALALDAATGDMTWLFSAVPHPVALVGRVVAAFERRLNRAERGATTRRARGVALVAGLTIAAAALGLVLDALARRLAFGWAAQLAIIAILLAQRSLFDRVRDVARALDRQGLTAGRAAVAHIVGRDPLSLDAHGVARAAIESLAENFGDGVVAPVFWTLIAGLPGLFVYKTANTLDSMIGHRSPRYRSFGWAAARFDDLLNLAPARLAAALLALAAMVIREARAGAALRTMLRDAGKHRSPNAGWPEAAMAGALGLALAGPRHYAELLVADPWLGNGRERATPRDIGRALALYAAACLLQAAAIAMLWLLPYAAGALAGGGYAG